MSGGDDAGAAGSASARFRADPNVTPMIDVLLVLLIVFMVTAQERKRDAEQKQRSLYVQAPAPSAAGGGAPSIVLQVEAGGVYAINHVAVPHAELGARLQAIYAARPDKVLFVRGSPTARYQEVVEAMSVARGAGVRVIGAAR